MSILKKLKNSISGEKPAADASDELSWHLEQRIQQYIRDGMTEADARAAARRQMGNITSLAEETAESDVFVWFDTFKREVLLALRMLRRAPTVAVVAILSLGLGIGANTVVFTLMKQVVLDYLPVPQPEQLVILHNQEPESGHTWSNGMKSSFSYPMYRDLDAGTGRVFNGVLAFRAIDVSLSGRESTENVSGAMVSGNFFQVLRVTPWRGRLLTASDDQKPGANPVAVIGYGLWKRRFGGNPGIVGQTIVLNKHPWTVVGIAPPQFYGIDVSQRSDLFVPMSMKADVVSDTRLLTDRLDHWASLIGRLKPGVSAQQAAAALAAIYPPFLNEDLAVMKSSGAFRQNYLRKRVLLSEGGKGYAELRDNLSNPLKILMAMVGIVLLITMVNVANLLVARGVARQREMAIRLSVGAGKGTLIRQLLMESLVLAGLGGCLGIAIAYGGTPALLHALSFDLNSASISARPDWHVMLFAGAVTITAGILFGLLPAWQSARTDVGAALKSEGSFGHSGHTGWLRRVLVVGQVALSLVLLTSAILFTRSLQNLEHSNVGFETSRLLKFEVNPLQAGYSQERIRVFGEDLRQKLAALPGVESAGVATVPLLEGTDEGGGVTVEGDSAHTDDAYYAYDGNLVSPEFFTAMQIPVIAGRQFAASDSLPTSNVAIVNETFAKHFLPGKNPIGMHFGLATGDKVALNQTIIGVVADSRHTSIRSKIIPFIYEPYLAVGHLSSLHFYVRLRSGQVNVAPAIRNLVHQLDADLPVNGLTSMSEIIDESLFVERSLGYLSIGFALLATLLAVVGLYGVMSYSVTSRYRELGIRMAIGATPRGVLSMVLRESAYLGIGGAVCGIPLVLGTASYIRSSLYGVQANDPLIWCSAVVLLIGIALLAGLVPAWHAARIDPHSALRSE